MAAPATRLVIFDCDGVLVDSEPISMSVLLDVLSEIGAPIDAPDAYRRFLGRSMKAIAEIVRLEFGVAVTPEHLDIVRSRLYARFRGELKAVAGTRDCVSRLAIPFCVASSSQLERIRLSLEVTGLLELFEPNLYSSSMVKSGKPAPDLFLHAARQMGVEPARCVVIEDSPAGIEAAKRADMRVFAFTGGAHAPEGRLRERVAALKPDCIFDDMRALPGLVGHADRTG